MSESKQSLSKENGATSSYTSTVTVVLDTICPWTYLSFKRLKAALAKLPPSHPVHFNVRIAPFQLHPDLPEEGTNKWDWYISNRFGTEDKMRAYTAVMSSYGRSIGIEYKFGGNISNSLNSLRAVCWIQDGRNGGDPERAQKVMENLYRKYFEEEKNIGLPETILEALTEAGIPEQEAKDFLDDKYEYLSEVKSEVQEQAANGVDAVPFITIEGKKRDLHLEGAKEVQQYLTAFETITKESI